MRRRFAEEKIATKYIKVKHREREIVVILENQRFAPTFSPRLIKVPKIEQRSKEAR